LFAFVALSQALAHIKLEFAVFVPADGHALLQKTNILPDLALAADPIATDPAHVAEGAVAGAAVFSPYRLKPVNAPADNVNHAHTVNCSIAHVLAVVRPSILAVAIVNSPLVIAPSDTFASNAVCKSVCDDNVPVIEPQVHHPPQPPTFFRCITSSYAIIYCLI